MEISTLLESLRPNLKGKEYSIRHLLFEIDHKIVGKTIANSQTIPLLKPTYLMRALTYCLQDYDKRGFHKDILSSDIETLVSYIYELYLSQAEELCVRKNIEIYEYLLFDDTPEYILKAAQSAASKTTRPYLIRAALHRQEVMYDWWFTYINHHATTYVLESKEKAVIKDILTLYPNLSNVKTKESKREIDETT